MSSAPCAGARWHGTAGPPRGTQRWLCKSCRVTATHRIDNGAKLLKTFLDWPFPSRTQAETRWGARTLRRKRAKFREARPMPQPAGEAHRVAFVDGLHIVKNVHAPIAGTDGHVVGRHLARSENSRAWAALTSPIPPPGVVVADGGGGFEKARKKAWPGTRVQRCAFNAFNQVEVAPWDEYAASRQGGVLVVPHAVGMPAAASRDFCGDAYRRRHRRAVSPNRLRAAEERRAGRMGRRPGLGGAASLVVLAYRSGLIIRQHVLAYNPDCPCLCCLFSRRALLRRR